MTPETKLLDSLDALLTSGEVSEAAEKRMKRLPVEQLALNPVLQEDLRAILHRTLPARRLAVATMWLGEQHPMVHMQRRIGANRSTFARWWYGYMVPSWVYKVRIAKCFGIEVEEFLGDSE